MRAGAGGQPSLLLLALHSPRGAPGRHRHLQAAAGGVSGRRLPPPCQRCVCLLHCGPLHSPPVLRLRALSPAPASGGCQKGLCCSKASCSRNAGLAAEPAAQPPCPRADPWTSVAPSPLPLPPLLLQLPRHRRAGASAAGCQASQGRHRDHAGSSGDGGERINRWGASGHCCRAAAAVVAGRDLYAVVGCPLSALWRPAAAHMRCITP